MITRLVQHFHRLTRARRFGVPFTRRASFRLPPRIQLGDQSVPVSSPAEDGAARDFLTCFIDDEYGLSEIDFPVQTITDIGSNIGFFSMAARSYYPAATIHSYEPNPRLLPYSSENASVAHFTLFPEAVGAEPGYVSIDDSSDSNQARTISASDASVRIPRVSLSTVVERLGGRIDFAKIDCEGAEWDLFTDRAAWKCIRHVRMEYHLWGKHVFADVEQSLREIGFEIYRHRPSGEWGTVWARNIKT